MQSTDSLVTESPDEIQNAMTVEFLNSITVSGFPLSHLALKVGSLMLLHNLDPGEGHCPMSGSHSHGCLGSEPMGKKWQKKDMLWQQLLIWPQVHENWVTNSNALTAYVARFWPEEISIVKNLTELPWILWKITILWSQFSEIRKSLWSKFRYLSIKANNSEVYQHIVSQHWAL